MNWFENMIAMKDCYMGNIAAIILVCLLFAANYKKTNGRIREYKTLMHLLGLIGLYALVEILSCIFEGMPGIVITVVLYILNSALFAINIILEFGWVQFISLHLRYSVPKYVQYVLRGFMILGFLLLVINPIFPVAFYLEDGSYYKQGPLYLIFILIAIVYLGYTIIIYIACRRNGGAIKYFPVWMYVVPTAIGMLLEWLLQSSLTSICNAIAISVVLTSMRQEEVFRDKLTGLYNRAYLEELKIKLSKENQPYVSGIMLDLNRFKDINDNFGHAEGDQALKIAADLVRNAVGSYGDVIRYAGDEFVIILNSWDDSVSIDCIKRINDAFENINNKNEKPYNLSASFGYAKFNAGSQTINEFMNLIDRNMYDNKRKYYEGVPAD